MNDTIEDGLHISEMHILIDSRVPGTTKISLVEINGRLLNDHG